MNYQEYISTISKKERDNIAEVVTEISLHRVLENSKEHKRVLRVIQKLLHSFEMDYQLQHYESIAVIKMLQDTLLADCYEQIMNALQHSHDEETFVSHFIASKNRS